MVYEECDIRIDFSRAISARKFDPKHMKTPQGMSFVDVVVEERDRILLIEIKDPSNPNPRSRPDKFVTDFNSNELIAKTLVPKARDSYTFEHLMERDDKPFIYIVLIGAEKLGLSGVALTDFKDRLLARLRKETDTAWVRFHIQDCVVVTTTDWNDRFSDYPLTRISAR